MRVLLTGATGFIGRHVARSLHDDGIETVTLGIESPATPGKSIALNLLEPSGLDAAIREARATHLLHFAWYTEHGKYWASPLNLRWVEATTRLVDAFCSSGGRHVTVAGTCAEYDWSYGYCREDITPTAPATLYGRAKDAARRLVMAACEQYGTSCAWGRVFLPYGPGENPARLVPSLVDVFRGARSPFETYGAAYRDLLHVSDVATAFVTLARRDAEGVFNVSSGEPIRLSDLATALAGILGADPTPILRLSTPRKSEPNLLVGDSSKLRGLGWAPRHSIISGLETVTRGPGSDHV